MLDVIELFSGIGAQRKALEDAGINHNVVARAIKIAAACGLCEKCGKPGNEVHHKIHLTPQNINDPNIAINQDNLILLCNECHNKEHGRFEGKREYEFDCDGNLIKK